MTDTHDVRVSARTAELTASPDDGAEGEGPYTFHGVAVGEGDILYTDDGKPVYFGPDELAAAGQTQAGEPLTTDHPTDENGNPVYPPPLEETHGKVTKAEYVPGKGLAYEANTHNEDVGEGLKAENFEVSVHPQFDLGEFDDEVQAYRPENLEFLDLSVVSKGMSASNQVNWGPSSELLAWTRSGDLEDDLEATDDVDVEATVPETEAEAIGWFRQMAERIGLTASESPSTPNEPAESGADSETPMEDEPPADTDPEEQTPTDPEPDTDPDTEGGDGDGGPPISEMTVDELGAALREQGFVTEDDADTLVEEATAQQDKREQVDEIIARSDEYDEDDREDLMASPDPIVEKTHSQITAQTSASLPGMTSTKQRIQASATDEDDLDEFGTGVQE